MTGAEGPAEGRSTHEQGALPVQREARAYKALTQGQAASAHQPAGRQPPPSSSPFPFVSLVITHIPPPRDVRRAAGGSARAGSRPGACGQASRLSGMAPRPGALDGVEADGINNPADARSPRRSLEPSVTHVARPSGLKIRAAGCCEGSPPPGSRRRMPPRAPRRSGPQNKAVVCLSGAGLHRARRERAPPTLVPLARQP